MIVDGRMRDDEVRGPFREDFAQARNQIACAGQLAVGEAKHRQFCAEHRGGIGGLAGALIANQSSYVSPSLLHWIQSGTLMIMVILGGVGTLWGGVIGAAVLLGLEHLIADYRVDWLAALAPNYQDHGALAVGIVLLAIVMLAPQGLAGLFGRRRHA